MRRARRQVRSGFLLLEVVASLGLLLFFTTGLFLPYTQSRIHLQALEREIELQRVAQLASMELHSEGLLLHYLPSWSRSEVAALQGCRWSWPESALELSFTCDNQTPKRPDEEYPAWRRLITAHWRFDNRCIWSHSFVVISGKPDARATQTQVRVS